VPVTFSIESDRIAEPWFPEVLKLLDLRPGERVLQVSGRHAGQARAVLEHIRPGGSLLVVEPDRGRAARLADDGDDDALHVLSFAPGGDESFGQHDALLGCLLRLDDWPAQRWGELAVNNLRPGGRLVVDLPAQTLCEAVFACWEPAGGDDAALAPWRGPTETELATALRDAGLRKVSALVGTHLVRAESPRRLAEFAAETLAAPRDLVESLHVELAARLGTNGPIEVIFHRTRVHAMR
jgi:hypothetical protein